MLHDKNLKATVASMKADAKAQFSKIIDFDQYREFLLKGKALDELRVSGPIMNLLQMVYSDNFGTGNSGKVNHKNFKLGKILQSMTESPEFDFIQSIYCFAKNLAELIPDETPNQMGIMINSDLRDPQPNGNYDQL